MGHFPISRLLIPDHGLFPISHQRMVTSFHAGRHGTGLTFDRFFDKCVRIGAGETHSVAEIDGPGLIVRLYFTFPILPLLKVPLRDLILRVFYDGATDPSVEVPVGDFFGLPFGRYTRYGAFFLACLSGGYLSQFPIPFRKSVRIALSNLSDRAAHMVFHQVNCFRLESLPEGCPYFMASWRRENPTRRHVPYAILERQGAGWYVGCNLQTQARESFLLRPWRDLVWPQGWGLGNLEGCERVFIDGEEAPSFHGTGHEELFNAAWYYTCGKDAGLFAGNLHRSYLQGRAAAYRHHLMDPIPFAKGIRVEIDHGIQSTLEADYASTAYWYEALPHRPLPALGAARDPSPWLGHAVQALALPIAAPLGLVAAVPSFLTFLWRGNRSTR
ncbi:MAG: DUF2961 domain-containing protein [Candidatus Schekmanbacteria bacterium]|nr:DUF2961 domain-containing protein [Candidatus Schekmanbacteria bacterium]